MTMLRRLAFILRYVDSYRMRSRVCPLKILVDQSFGERCAEMV